MAPTQLQALVALLKKAPATGLTLQDVLGVSQPTFSRWIRELGPQVIQWEVGRSHYYALVREVVDLPRFLPIYHFSDGTNPHRHLFNLYPVYPRGYTLISFSQDEVSAYFEDLPWFLDPLRPSGFLGRSLAQNAQDLDLPPDIRLWTGDQCLHFLNTLGWDMPGALVVGDISFELYDTSDEEGSLLKPADVPARYSKWARDVIAGVQVGSSAGGEQPKFVVSRKTEQGHPLAVLVKFSPEVDSVAAVRHADLIQAEHVALTTLRQGGYSAAQSRLWKGGGRVFLETERFDRVDHLYRRGVVSLSALEAEFVGGAAPGWAGTTAALLAQRLILPEDHLLVRKMELFGRLIYNTDMHLGNFSFFLEGTHIRGPTPVYDMLPMGLAPTSQGEIRPVNFVPPSPSPADADIWPEMWALALTFWELCQREPEISESFKKIAADIHSKISALSSKIRLLPQPVPPPKRRGRPPKSGRR